MKDRSSFILTGVAACIFMLLLITPALAASIVIGGDSTDVGNIIVISPKTGDTAAANGTALLNTLNGITDNASTNRYLIKLGPGTYDLASTSLVMKPYVSIEGSGEKATTITAAVSTDVIPPDTATVQGADNAGLRFLTVENTGAGDITAAILNSSASPSMIHVTAAALGEVANFGVCNSFSSPTMTNVTATASGGAGSQNIGVYNNSSSPKMTNVTADASGVEGIESYGVFNSSSSLTMTNVTADASGASTNYGVYSDGVGTVKINYSVIRGTITIYNSGSTTTLIGNTQLDGGAVLGTLTCVGAYNATYVALGTNCK